MAFILDNLPQSLIVIGIVALIIEILVLGFSTFVLLFLGLSFIFSGAMMYANLIPHDWLTALWVNGVLTLGFALVLWKPLVRLQESAKQDTVHTDFADIEFTLEDDLDAQNQLFHTYSGINWQLKSQQPLAKGTKVQVVKKEVGVMWVEAVRG